MEKLNSERGFQEADRLREESSRLGFYLKLSNYNKRMTDAHNTITIRPDDRTNPATLKIPSQAQEAFFLSFLSFLYSFISFSCIFLPILDLYNVRYNRFIENEL